MWTVNRLTDGILLYKLFQIHYSSMPMSVVYSIKKPQIRLKVRKVGISAKHLDTIHPQRLYPQCTGWCWGTSHLEASPQDVCQQELGDLQSRGWGGKRGHFCGSPNLLLPTSTLVNEHLMGWWLLGWCWEHLELSMWVVHGSHGTFFFFFFSCF